MGTDTNEIARETFATVKGAAPAWAAAAIVAEFETDQSDMMTDYFATRTERTIVIGWSKHTRDLFSEMRKAAATFPPTAHLGPGCDVWTVAVEQLDDVIANGSAFYKGQLSHWHGDILGVDSSVHGRQFETESAARAWIAEQPATEPHTIHFSDQPVRFGWRVSKKSIEHREKYSMGAGYYLKGSGAYSTGWTVSKRTIGGRGTDGWDVYDPSAAPVVEPAPVAEIAPEPSARVLQFAESLRLCTGAVAVTVHDGDASATATAPVADHVAEGLTADERRLLAAMVANADSVAGGDFGIIDEIDYRAIGLSAYQFGALVTCLQSKGAVTVHEPVLVNGTERVQQFTIERAPAPVEPERPRVEYNGERDGLEVHFPAKPAADVLAALKADGWRWSRFSGCWYRKASENARQSAQTILGIEIEPGILAASRAFAAGAKGED